MKEGRTSRPNFDREVAKFEVGSATTTSSRYIITAKKVAGAPKGKKSRPMVFYWIQPDCQRDPKMTQSPRPKERE